MARYFDRIAARFKRQEQKGISKYGQILEDNPRGFKEALEYAAEEVTDLLMYLEEAIEKVYTTAGSCGTGGGTVQRNLKDLLSDLDWDSDGNLINRQTKEVLIGASWCDGPYLEMAVELQNFFITNQYGILLERAIKAEESVKTLKSGIAKFCDGNYEDIIALQEENDLQRQSIQDLSAQVVAYQKVLGITANIKKDY